MGRGFPRIQRINADQEKSANIRLIRENPRPIRCVVLDRSGGTLSRGY
jgi:hypothetical protein